MQANTQPRRAAVRAAFPHTIPVLTGFLFLGAAYGILMNSKGFAFYWSILMSAATFAGSMQFVAINLLTSAFNPLCVFSDANGQCAAFVLWGVHARAI